MFGKDKKKRSRRVNTKYGQKTLKHARKGIQSCMMAVLCAVILIVMILVSFLMKGNVSTHKLNPKLQNSVAKQLRYLLAIGKKNPNGINIITFPNRFVNMAKNPN